MTARFKRGCNERCGDGLGAATGSKTCRCMTRLSGGGSGVGVLRLIGRERGFVFGVRRASYLSVFGSANKNGEVQW